MSQNSTAVVFSPQVGLPKAHNYVPDNQVFKFTQSVETQSWATTSVTIPTFISASFTLSALDQATQLAAVFDQYRIDEVEAWIIPHLTSNNSASGNPGLYTSVVDYDDASALGSIGAALDYTNAVTSSGCSGHYRRFKPHVAVAAYSGAFTSFANEPSPWIDAASPGVIHYGLKCAFTPTSSVETMDLVYRLHVSFRNLR